MIVYVFVFVNKPDETTPPSTAFWTHEPRPVRSTLYVPLKGNGAGVGSMGDHGQAFSIDRPRAPPRRRDSRSCWRAHGPSNYRASPNRVTHAVHVEVSISNPICSATRMGGASTLSCPWKRR